MCGYWSTYFHTNLFLLTEQKPQVLANLKGGNHKELGVGKFDMIRESNTT